MQPSYQIETDPSRHFLHLKFSGFFDHDARRRFIVDRDAAVASLRCGRNQHLTLCDGSDVNVLSQDAIEDFRRAVGDPRYASRRLAIVVKGALVTLQAKRITDHKDVAIFADEAAAMAWLFTEETASAAT